MMLFKDLIRLLACYNDGIINLLGTYRCLPVIDSVSIFFSSMSVTSLCAVSQSVIIMAAEDKAIIFYRCILLFFYFVGIDENQPWNLNQIWPVGRK